MLPLPSHVKPLTQEQFAKFIADLGGKQEFVKLVDKVAQDHGCSHLIVNPSDILGGYKSED